MRPPTLHLPAGTFGAPDNHPLLLSSRRRNTQYLNIPSSTPREDVSSVRLGIMAIISRWAVIRCGAHKTAALTARHLFFYCFRILIKATAAGDPPAVTRKCYFVFAFSLPPRASTRLLFTVDGDVFAFYFTAHCAQTRTP